MIRIESFVVTCLAVGLLACDERSPVVPLPPPLTSGTPAVPTGMVLVRDSSGAPVAGAEVTYWPPGDIEFTNAAGLFELTRTYYEDIFVNKPGYEPAMFSADVSVELTLREIIRIPVGESVQVTVGPFDSVGGPGYRYQVRTIRLVTNESVQAQIQVSSADGGPVDFWIQNRSGDLCAHWVDSTRLTVVGGQEYQILVAVPLSTHVGRTFTVKTSRVES